MEDHNIATPELLQRELKRIRSYMDLSTQELADYLGVTRQTINNLEAGKTRLSDTQVIALLAIIDRRLSHSSKEYAAVRALIREPSGDGADSPSLLDLWLDCLELRSIEEPAVLPNGVVDEKLTDSLLFVMYDLLMEEKAIDVLRALVPHLLQSRRKIILPRVHAVKLIEASEHGDAARAAHAQRVMHYFVQLNADDLMQIRGKEGDDFETDNDLIAHILSRYSAQGHIAILKQNVSELKLTAEAVENCSFYRIDPMGLLERYEYPAEKLTFYKLLDDAEKDDL